MTMNSSPEAIAHIKKHDDKVWESPHILDSHLQSVSLLAEKMAEGFGQEWAFLAGQWHDLGKYQSKFQLYIRKQSGYDRENAHIENAPNRVTHSTAGAIHAIKTLGPTFGHILAYIISGHHAGLPDWYGAQGSLDYRLKEGDIEYLESLAADIPSALLSGELPPIPEFARSPDTIALWMRMLFSCLVDADFLDTESYMDPQKQKLRGKYPQLPELQQQFDVYMGQLGAENQNSNSKLNKIRQQILAQCLDAAKLPMGLFSLTVPTGGGKTLSSLGFALEHARIYKKIRIIYAIPFTSIIEQNAAVFRRVLGDDAVLEHHSNLDNTENTHSRLASENWDVPLVVTTNVQLFESLHAARSSRCRKLHNLINSIIILDEAQQLPRDFHAPITQMMQQLSKDYGVTWVLCTATQPELAGSKDAFGRTLLTGLGPVHEIITDPLNLAAQLKRVRVELPADLTATPWQSLASELAQENCVLSIVNTRRHARDLYELLPDDGNKLHLSAHMCAEHRSAVLAEIRGRLLARQQGDHRALRVVSTQLVEAGVDVDFPVVYRAMAGLDSIAQAAGRCNREGKLSGLGRVKVFVPEQPAPSGFLRQAQECTQAMLFSDRLLDPLSPSAFSSFFRHLNAKGSRDKHEICRLLRASQSIDAPLAIQFREAAEKFRLIDDQGISVVVPYTVASDVISPVESWISLLESDASQSWVYRKLQRYTVTIPESLAKGLVAIGALSERAGLWVLLESHYHPLWGVQPPATLLSAEESVI